MKLAAYYLASPQCYPHSETGNVLYLQVMLCLFRNSCVRLSYQIVYSEAGLPVPSLDSNMSFLTLMQRCA